jgi:glycosyltransferase involved in cell wall biosynthesis
MDELSNISKDINLWVISYLFFPVWAGPAERFMRYGPGLRERKIEMTMITAMRPGQPRTELKNGITVERIGNSNRGVASTNSFLIRAVLKALIGPQRPNILLFLPVGHFLLPFLVLLKSVGIKTTYVHTMARLDFQRRDSLKKRFLNRLKYKVYNGFDYIVCSTQALTDDLTTLGIRTEKVKAIPNGVSLTRFRPPTGSDEIRKLRKELSLPIDEKIALYVGLRTERKGVIELVNAWKLYRAKGGTGWLVLVGEDEVPPSLSFVKRWNQCSAEIQPSDQIEIRPAYNKIEDYYRAADLFVFLSELEGMPNVIPESMACGLPVLSTRFRGFSGDFGRDGVELVITERNPEEISLHLARLLSDAQLRKSLSNNGRAWIEKYQDVEEVLNQYVALFCQALNET